MRLTLSTIFAAALVFFGTLLFAYYSEPPRDYSYDTVGVDPETLWHCPEIEHILAGPLSEIFGHTHDPLDELSDRYKWRKARLYGNIDTSLYWVLGTDIVCEYRVRPGMEYGAPESQPTWTLSIATDLQGKIVRPPLSEDGWGPTHFVGDVSAPAFECSKSLDACGFYAVPVE